MTLVGHTLTGAAIGVLCKPEHTSKTGRVAHFCVFVLLANAPDLPFKHWGHNRYDVSHSIFVALLAIAIATGLLASWKTARTKIGGWRTLIGGAAAWLSHLLLDSFYNHGRGIAIFWPFSGSRLALPIPWFSVVTASTRFTSHGLREYLVELASYLPVLLLAVGLQRIATGTSQRASTLPRSVHLFISSSPDLAAEREALGQAVAELPISVGFEIMHTVPGEAADIGEALACIERCDLYVIVLGADFAAPMGIEWQRAQDALKPTLAYAKREMHSPSSQKLLRESGVTWEPFVSPQALKAHATQALAQMLLDRGEKFGLHVDDVDGLLAVLGKEEKEPPDKPDRREGAGRGGIILGREG